MVWSVEFWGFAAESLQFRVAWFQVECFCLFSGLDFFGFGRLLFGLGWR